jgi:hypothetical protein
MAALITIGVLIVGFLLVLIGLGEFYGGNWEIVAQGVTNFILIIVGFAFACFVIIKVIDKW